MATPGNKKTTKLDSVVGLLRKPELQFDKKSANPADTKGYYNSDYSRAASSAGIGS